MNEQPDNTLKPQNKAEETAAPKTEEPTQAPPAQTPPTQATPAETPPTQASPINTKRLFPKLSILSPFKRHKSPPLEPAATVTEQAVSPDTQQLTNEVLMKMIDEKIQKINGDDFLVIKLSKRGLLLVAGLALILIWTFPLLDIGFQKLKSGINFPALTLPFSKKPHDATGSETPDAAPSPPPLTESRIRVRSGNESKEINDSVLKILSESGFSKVEMLEDNQVMTSTVLIVSSDNDTDLKPKLTELLSKNFSVSTESATLTEDSDFAATVLVGKNVKLKVFDNPGN